MGWAVSATPRLLYPRKRPGTHCIGGWMGLSGRMRNISPPPGFDSRTVWPVASRYTNYAIPVHPLSLLRSMLVFSYHLRLAVTYRFFPSRFGTEILYVFLVFPMRTGLLHQTLQPDVIMLIAFYEDSKLCEALFVLLAPSFCLCLIRRC